MDTDRDLAVRPFADRRTRPRSASRAPHRRRTGTARRTRPGPGPGTAQCLGRRPVGRSPSPHARITPLPEPAGRLGVPHRSAAPARAKAASKPGKVLGKALRKEYRRLAGRMEPAFDMAPGPERDAAIHHARKAVKRLRYAAEAARPALGGPARRLGKRAKAVQQVSGAQHDSVVTREAVLRLAVSAHAAGEPGFTWGVLHGREGATADARERQLPQAWAKARAAARSKALRS
ncbi:CHAD domain-containing protein [Streptomyces sp. NPDC059371]|uniref:CHAD domain-containing protein n=1 Tax=Streptomyces sp. NPDC059371 TaxID=3346812 RepID=UPI003691FFB5